MLALHDELFSQNNIIALENTFSRAENAHRLFCNMHDKSSCSFQPSLTKTIRSHFIASHIHYLSTFYILRSIQPIVRQRKLKVRNQKEFPITLLWEKFILLIFRSVTVCCDSFFVICLLSVTTSVSHSSTWIPHDVLIQLVRSSFKMKSS